LFFVSIAVLVTVPFQEVARARVEKFAWRQQLRITVANGQVVIAYLATTRRWRGCGIIATLVGSALALYTKLVPSGHFNAFTLVVGWFFGAVIAEWRVNARTAASVRRVALLVPRTESDYLTGRVRSYARIVLLATLGFEIAALVTGSNEGQAVVLLLVTAAAIGGLWLVSRRILTRPQPDTTPDVFAADEAIRSRSLHVLSGSAVALSSWFGYLAADLVLHGQNAQHGLQLASLVTFVLGTRIALHTSMPPRRLSTVLARGAVV
jgi:hypothetical protein